MLVVCVPKLGREPFGHHLALSKLVQSLNSLDIRATVLGSYDAPKSDTVVPWFSRIGGNLSHDLFIHEVSEFITRRNIDVKSVFVYDADVEIAEAFGELARDLPQLNFHVNILHLSSPDIKSLSAISAPNLTLSSETKAGVNLIKSFAKEQTVSKIPVFSPTPVSAYLNSLQRNPNSVLTFASKHLSRGFNHSSLAIGIASKKLKKGLSVEIKIESPGMHIDNAMHRNPLAKGLIRNAKVIDHFQDDYSFALLFRRNSVTLLGYAPSQFAYQPSGNFIHALLNESIPVVLAGTWMADELVELGLEGLISLRPSDLGLTVVQALSNQEKYRKIIREKKAHIASRYSPTKFSEFLGLL